MSPAAGKGALTVGQRFAAWVASPTGPKTTHFWGPVANWGFVLAVSAAAHDYARRCLFCGGRGHARPLAAPRRAVGFVLAAAAGCASAAAPGLCLIARPFPFSKRRA